MVQIRRARGSQRGTLSRRPLVCARGHRALLSIIRAATRSVRRSKRCARRPAVAHPAWTWSR